MTDSNNKKHSVEEILSVISNPESDKVLTIADAHELIKAGHRDVVIKNPSRFYGLDDFEVEEMLLDAWDNEIDLDRRLSTDILRELKDPNSTHKFSYEDVDYLFQQNVAWLVVMHFDKFEGLNHAEIANRLIESGDGGFVATHLQKFKDVNFTDIAYRLIDSGKGYAVADQLENFIGIDHQDIARRLLDANCGRYIATHMDKFGELDSVTLRRIIEQITPQLSDN